MNHLWKDDTVHCPAGSKSGTWDHHARAPRFETVGAGLLIDLSCKTEREREKVSSVLWRSTFSFRSLLKSPPRPHRTLKYSTLHLPPVVQQPRGLARRTSEFRRAKRGSSTRLGDLARAGEEREEQGQLSRGSVKGIPRKER